MVAGTQPTSRQPVDEPAGEALLHRESLVQLVVDLVVAAGVLLALACVLWRIGHGFDLTDEASYIQAADPPQRGDAFNGFFGLYLRPLWQLAGWHVATMRLIGLAGLVGAAVLLGRATARLTRCRPGPIVGVTIAGATGYYGAGLRTPSYNWLALVGAVLLCAALLHVLADGSNAWGALGGAGIAVASAGKVTTGVLLAALLGTVAVTRRRSRVLLAASAALLVALAVHVVAVLGRADSVRMMRRSAAMLAAVDPAHYTLQGSMRALAAQVPLVAFVAVLAGVAGVSCAVVRFLRSRRESWFALAAVVVITEVVGVLLYGGIWSGGFDNGLRFGSGPLPLLATIAGLGFAGRFVSVDGAPPARGTGRGVGTGVAVLVAAAVACAAGSNVSLGWILGTTGVVLLVPACLLACQALPVRTIPVVTGAVLVAVALGTTVAAAEAHADPKKTAPLGSPTRTVALGPANVRVDAESAAALDRLSRAAHRAGWRPGMKLVDTTYTPAVPLVLGAEVPSVLLPGFPGLSQASVCRAVGADPGRRTHWRDSWLLVPRDAAPADVAQAAACLGRRWPDDYDPVTSFTTPWINVPTLLFRPR